MKGKTVNHHIGLIPKVALSKLFLNHSQFRKSQESLEVVNPVTRILLTCIAPATLHVFSSFPTSTKRAW